MSCKCGNKVNRVDPHKLRSMICQQYMHLKCYDINVAELVFLKNKFKCKEYLKEHHHSRLFSASVSVVGSSNNCTNDRKIDESANSCSSDAIDVDMDGDIKLLFLNSGFISFKTSATTADIMKYVVSHSNIDESCISCFKLIKKRYSCRFYKESEL